MLGSLILLLKSVWARVSFVVRKTVMKQKFPTKQCQISRLRVQVHHDVNLLYFYVHSFFLNIVYKFMIYFERNVYNIISIAVPSSIFAAFWQIMVVIYICSMYSMYLCKCMYVHCHKYSFLSNFTIILVKLPKLWELQTLYSAKNNEGFVGICIHEMLCLL